MYLASQRRQRVSLIRNPDDGLNFKRFTIWQLSSPSRQPTIKSPILEDTCGVGRESDSRVDSTLAKFLECFAQLWLSATERPTPVTLVDPSAPSPFRQTLFSATTHGNHWRLSQKFKDIPISRDRGLLSTYMSL
jgi:hypothetical protein